MAMAIPICQYGAVGMCQVLLHFHWIVKIGMPRRIRRRLNFATVGTTIVMEKPTRERQRFLGTWMETVMVLATVRSLR